MKTNPKCKICKLGAEDVPYPDNFKLTEDGVCLSCKMQQEGYIPDYRSDEQRYIDTIL